MLQVREGPGAGTRRCVTWAKVICMRTAALGCLAILAVAAGCDGAHGGVASDWTRTNHHVGVTDLDARAMDPLFPTLTLAASKPTADGAWDVNFVPSHAYSRSALAYARLPGHDLGLVYASYGNVRDLQPF